MRKRTRFSPKKAKPGAFWVLEGMGTIEDGSNQMRKPSVRTKTNPIPMQHMQKENRQKPRVSAGFLAGAEGLGLGCRLGRFAAERHWRSLTPRHALRRAQPCLVAESLCALTKNREASIVLASLFLAGAEGLSLACRLGRFAAERHWRSLTPRHAVLEWMWENTTGSKRGPVLPDSSHKPQNEWCWFGAVSSFWRRIVYRLPLLPSKEKHLRQEDGQADQDHGRVGPGGI